MLNRHASYSIDALNLPTRVRNTLVRAGDDLTEARNLCIVSLILVCGIGGMVLSFGKFTLGGIGLAGIIGVVLNLVLPGKKSE